MTRYCDDCGLAMAQDNGLVIARATCAQCGYREFSVYVLPWFGVYASFYAHGWETGVFKVRRF